MAVRESVHGPMREITADDAIVGAGLALDPSRSGARGVTFLSRSAWSDACVELGTVLHWSERRANVLLEGVPLEELIGRKLQIGGAIILIRGETKPCAVMDRAQMGLRTALASSYRGGVYGEVIQTGRMSVGDSACLVPPGGMD